MDQLTQMEFLQLRELLAMEALSARKCELYAGQVVDGHLQALLAESAGLHQRNLDLLVGQLRSLSGRPELAAAHGKEVPAVD